MISLNSVFLVHPWHSVSLVHCITLFLVQQADAMLFLFDARYCALFISGELTYYSVLLVHPQHSAFLVQQGNSLAFVFDARYCALLIVTLPAMLPCFSCTQSRVRFWLLPSSSLLKQE